MTSTDLRFITHKQVWKSCTAYYLMELRGIAMIRITQEDENYFTLSDFYVYEQYRKQGIGTRIILEAINLCKSLTRHGHIQLATNDHSEAFCDEWYQRLGFKFNGLETPLSLEDKDDELEWNKLYKLNF